MPYSMLSELKQTHPFASAQEELYLSLACTMVRLRREVVELLKVHEMSEGQYNVLHVLRGSKSLSCTEIGERLVTADSDVTRLLDRLEKSGLVQRSRGLPDRRIVWASITPEGMKLLESLDTLILNLHRQQLEFIGGEETKLLLGQLSQTRERLAKRAQAN
jgi:DNA-binding MarR family transcriptional regulator